MPRYARYVKKAYPAVQKRARVYVPAVKQLASDVMYLKGLINSEPQSHHLETSANYNYNGNIFNLSNIAQGDAEGTRTGNRVLPRYLNVYVHVNQIATTAPSTHCTHRLIIFRAWTESTGTAPTVSDVLETVGTQYAPLSHLNEQFTGPKGDRNRRIEVLRNEFFTLDTVSKTSMDFHYNIVMNSGNKKDHIEFANSATAPPVSGGIFLLVVSSNPDATDSGIWIGSNLTYYDN